MAFDIVDRAAAGRLGRFTTPHGRVTTPTLMPVVNPNIDLVTPQEMKERFGAEMVITNSYVFHKHENLRLDALERGVHDVIGFDGTIMTDSGTFQSYVYGDVQLDPQDIVAFQRDIGVDVATCLDKFITPDMSRHEAEEGVRETLARTEAACAVAHQGTEDGAKRGPTMVNATVQGGVFLDLRAACAQAYRAMDVDYHTIGGVVPVMEQQRYPDLVDIILTSQRHLRKDRPVHLFGAGHPLVFPLATALGCDLFDSSSYAKYAKDGRIMVPEGTLHVEDLVEWPFTSPSLDGWTPQEITQALKKRGKTGKPGQTDHHSDPNWQAQRALALHNLDVCFADIRRIRHAIREGTLWELVEQRAACHPMLAAATRRLGAREHAAWLEAREPLSHNKALRYTGSLTHRRPQFTRIRKRLQERYTPLAPAVEVQGNEWAEDGAMRVELAMHKEPDNKPYRDRVGNLDAEQEHIVVSALGPVPVGLDEAYPFAQSVLPRLDGLDTEHMGWVGQTKDAFLEAHGVVPAIPGAGMPDGRIDKDRLQVIRTADWQFGAGAGKVLTEGELRIEKSPRTHKIRTVHLDGEHVLSLRAHDAFWTLKPAGARLLHAGMPAPALRVVVHSDSVPFNREGKSVFNQFVVACDPELRPGDECLVVDEDDALLALGQVRLNAEEMADFQGGMAVKVRDGFKS